MIAFPASTTTFDIAVAIEDNSILSVEDKELLVILLPGDGYVVDTQADVASITIEDDEGTYATVHTTCTRYYTLISYHNNL